MRDKNTNRFSQIFLIFILSISLLLPTALSYNGESDLLIEVDTKPNHAEDYQTLLLDALDLLHGENGKEQNEEEAIKIIETVANHGSDDLKGEALFQLGQLYELGEGVTRNFEIAMKYFNQSAEYGNPKAQRELGFFYATGKACHINKPLSLLYYAFASQAGDDIAEMVLASKYLYGQSVIKSCEKAVQKFENVASSVVEKLEQTRLGGLTYHYESIRLSDLYQSKEKHKEEEDIVKFYKYSADSGDTGAQVTMGTLYLQGAYGVDQDMKAACQYFQLAAEAGDPSGHSHLGFMYAQGYGVDQNYDIAIQLYKQAAEKGHPLAQSNLGYMYMHGYGVPKNIQEALRWFKLAADQMHPEGQLNMGTLYYNGDGVKQDYAKAQTYFSLAAQQGNLIALYNLGQMYQYGHGIGASCSTAVQLYKRVAEKGPWHSYLQRAYSLYQNSDYDGALLYYEKAAEQGYEVAQTNAGWIYDKEYDKLDIMVVDESSSSSSGVNHHHEEKSSTTHHDSEEQKYVTTTVSEEKQWRYQRAFEYYRASAEQKNAHSLLMIGDYYWAGRGTRQDWSKAAQFYQAAGEMRSAQALFNLGYLHQHGLGLPRDLHLAKRYYDQARAVDPDNILAVQLALISLGAQYVWEGQLTWTTFSAWAGSQGIPFFAPVLPPHVQQPMNAAGASLSPFGDAALWTWDTYLLIVLSILLVICLILRQLIAIQPHLHQD